jgi:hypothetical protein
MANRRHDVHIDGQETYILRQERAKRQQKCCLSGRCFRYEETSDAEKGLGRSGPRLEYCDHHESSALVGKTDAMPPMIALSA